MIAIVRLIRLDVMISLATLILILACMMSFPRSWFWFWFLPLIAFYVRFHYLVMRYENELMHQWGRHAAGADRAQGGVGIADCTKEIAISAQQLHAPGEQLRIVGNE